MKLKKLIENIDDKKVSLEEKKAFLEEVAKYKDLGSVVYRGEGLRQVAEAVNKLIEQAERITLQETDEWFDEMTVRRNVKEIRRKASDFTKTCKEAYKLQQRLESLYEEIGTSLSRYYEI